MATEKGFSTPTWVAYGNQRLQDAFKADFKKAAAQANYPSKDEIGIIDDMTFELNHILRETPAVVSGYMHDEKRSFDLPAPDESTAPATLKVVSVDEKTKTGTIMLGSKAGEEYTSTIAAHEEVKVKNRTAQFKK